MISGSKHSISSIRKCLISTTWGSCSRSNSNSRRPKRWGFDTVLAQGIGADGPMGHGVASRFAWIYNRRGISFMQVSRWGNSLAVRLPAVVVEALDLKEGDEIEISIASKRDFKVARDRSKERALEQLRQMKWSFPPDFKFNREEINER